MIILNSERYGKIKVVEHEGLKRAYFNGGVMGRENISTQVSSFLLPVVEAEIDAQIAS